MNDPSLEPQKIAPNEYPTLKSSVFNLKNHLRTLYILRDIKTNRISDDIPSFTILLLEGEPLKTETPLSPFSNSDEQGKHRKRHEVNIPNI